jgi:hypothetical protein
VDLSVNYIDRLAAEITARLPEDKLPEGEDTTVLFRIYAVLALAKGVHTTAADVHNAWSAWMAGLDPSHESIAPYGELPANVRREDDIFVQAIRAAAER